MNAHKCISRSFMTCLVPADQLSVARLVLSSSDSSRTWEIGEYKGAKQCWGNRSVDPETLYPLDLGT